MWKVGSTRRGERSGYIQIGAEELLFMKCVEMALMKSRRLRSSNVLWVKTYRTHIRGECKWKICCFASWDKSEQITFIFKFEPYIFESRIVFLKIDCRCQGLGCEILEASRNLHNETNTRKKWYFFIYIKHRIHIYTSVNTRQSLAVQD